MDETDADQTRSAEAVARRALALFSVVGVALGANRVDILNWLKEVGLSKEPSPIEAVFLSDPSPSKQQIINASWYSERLIVLLWALQLTEMPRFDEQCDTSIFQAVLPPYADVDEKEFLRSATLRSEADLLKMADEILDLHWQARDASINGRVAERINLEIVQERHHAINWVVGYDELQWDDVTTDT